MRLDDSGESDGTALIVSRKAAKLACHVDPWRLGVILAGLSLREPTRCRPAPTGGRKRSFRCAGLTNAALLSSHLATASGSPILTAAMAHHRPWPHESFIPKEVASL